MKESRASAVSARSGGHPDGVEKRVIALGFFDGVHRGHAALLRRTVEQARALGACPCALTFDDHPEAHIIGHSVPLLNSVTDRADMMRHLYGIENVIFARFDNSLMHMDWKSFIRDMLVGRFQAVHVVAGYNFHFGHKGEGNPARLRAFCAELGVGCDIVDQVEIEGIPVSSTYIRKLVAQGDMERAELFLGHPHCLSGAVGHGNRLGSKIGVPTVNLSIPEPVLHPARGVYVSHVCFDGQRRPSVTNVGVRPTVALSGQVTVETSLLDFSGDLYGQTLWVEFHRFLRPERAFDTLEALKKQIDDDLVKARRAHGLLQKK